MDELSPPVTRRRKSRSKTPFLRSSCDNEMCTHTGEGHVHEKKKSPLGKKSSQISAIVEEIAESSAGAHQLQKKGSSTTTKVITSDYSSEDTSPEVTKVQSSVQTTTVVTRTHTMSASSSQNYENVDASSPQLSYSANRSGVSGKSKEMSQNELNAAFEGTQTIQTSTPLQSTSRKSEIRSPSNGNLSNHIAYKVYKEAGEYWKKYPKTDYTYSKLSSDRRELAPGVVAMPNMSRPSLDKHYERLAQMIQKNPSQEAFIKKRYSDVHYRQPMQNFAYDSQDETDFAEFSHKMFRQQTNTSVISRIVTRIVTIYYSFLQFFSTAEDNNYYSRIEEKQGFFGRTKSAISSAFFSVFRHIYLFISSVLYLDTCLLRSSSPDNRNKKRFLLFLLILLPFLLLAAWNNLNDEERGAIVMKVRRALRPSLLGLGSIYPSNWRNFVNLNVKFITQPESGGSSSSQYKYSSVDNNLQTSLSQEEYHRIVNHIDTYIQEIVDEKLAIERQKMATEETKISKEMSVLIANTVRENLIAAGIPEEINSTPKELKINENDIEKIAAEVRQHLQLQGQAEEKFSLSQDNLEQISKVIRENIEVNNKKFNIFEHVDVNEIIFRVLSSSELIDFVDSRILKIMDKDLRSEQELKIKSLVDEISLMKSTLLQHRDMNENMQISIETIKNAHNDVLKTLEDRENLLNIHFAETLKNIDLKLKHINQQQMIEINNQMKLYLVEVFGHDKDISEVDLKNWIRNAFVAKELLEEKLNDLEKHIENKFANVDSSLYKMITKNIKEDVLRLVEQKVLQLFREENGSRMSTSIVDVEKIVRDILSVYDADKTGLVDYALESAGGQVVSTRCTENYNVRSAQVSIFGIPLWYPNNTPRVAISPAVQPGECWAFQGFPGYLVLKLNAMIFVSGFTLEHIPKSLAPNGRIDSAPKKFSVWGLTNENDQDPVLFGEYFYAENGTALQYFPVQNNDIQSPYDLVELRIESNHGNLAYTCLYRFRVHGVVDT